MRYSYFWCTSLKENQILNPEVVVLLVLLTWWLDLPGRDGPPYQVLEYCAGVGRVAAMAKFAGFKAAAIDIEYGKSLGKERGSRPPMDLNSNAGLMLLGYNLFV